MIEKQNIPLSFDEHQSKFTIFTHIEHPPVNTLCMSKAENVDCRGPRTTTFGQQPDNFGLPQSLRQ